METEACAGRRNKQTRAAEAEALALDVEMVGAGRVGEHQLGIGCLFHLSLYGRTPGGQEGEISKANAARMVHEGLVALWVVPGMHVQGQKRAHHGTEINGVVGGQGRPRKLDKRNGRSGVDGQFLKSCRSW